MAREPEVRVGVRCDAGDSAVYDFEEVVLWGTSGVDGCGDVYRLRLRLRVDRGGVNAWRNCSFGCVVVVVIVDVV